MFRIKYICSQISNKFVDLLDFENSRFFNKKIVVVMFLFIHPIGHPITCN